MPCQKNRYSKFLIYREPSNCLSKRVDAFGSALQDGLSRARVALNHNFFPALSETALEGVPAPPDSNRTIADHHGVGSGGNHSFGRKMRLPGLPDFLLCRLVRAIP
jgi:hypothetical protein